MGSAAFHVAIAPASFTPDIPPGPANMTYPSVKDSSNSMIRKSSNNGTAYSVVDLGGARHIFASAVPNHGASLREQAEDALRGMQSVFQQEGSGCSIVAQNVFLSDVDETDECRQIIREFYGNNLPATTYIPQPPCNGKRLVIEAMGVYHSNGEIEIERHSEQLVVIRHDGITWIHSSHVTPSIPVPHLYDRSVDAFQNLRIGLAASNVRFDQMIRTWLYLGDITGPEGETQRYKELNRARTDFYREIQFAEGRLPPEVDWSVYPASTGIGTEGKEILMSGIALATERDDVMLVPLENPQQTAAFDYQENYSPKSPKFCRAMAITARDHASIFISGTASITKSETRFLDDAVGQTRQTLENIEALISRDNFQQHGMPQFGATLDDLALVRVYVKRQEDYHKAKAVCDELLGRLPSIYVVGDVCRPELLVEIEGIAFSDADSGTPNPAS